MDAQTDRTPPPHTLTLVADLFAEEHLLAEWSRDTQHPRLAAAYSALQGRIGDRCKDVRDAWSARYPEARKELLDATLAAHDNDRDTAFELSRLKRLLTARRDRLTHVEIPGYAPHADVEEDEAELLSRLIAELARGLC